MGEVQQVEITEVQVYPVNEDKLKAFVTITLDGCFVVKGIKVVEGRRGLFVAMPSKRRKDGTFVDIAHPLDRETRRMMEDKILGKYEYELKKGRAGDGARICFGLKG